MSLADWYGVRACAGHQLVQLVILPAEVRHEGTAVCGALAAVWRVLRRLVPAWGRGVPWATRVDVACSHNATGWPFAVCCARCEPSGRLQLDPTSSVLLGLPADDGAAEQDGGDGGPADRPTYLAQLISAYVTSTAVDPALSFLACAEISTVRGLTDGHVGQHNRDRVMWSQGDMRMHLQHLDLSASLTKAGQCLGLCHQMVIGPALWSFVSTDPPLLGRGVCGCAASHNSRTAGLLRRQDVHRTCDQYTLRPDNLEHEPFVKYFLHYELVPDGKGTTADRRGAEYVGTTRDGHHLVYRRTEPRLVRFSDFHPAHDPEGYCYSLLLRFFPFRHEDDLLSDANKSRTYYEECMIRGLLRTEGDLQRHIEA